MAQMQQAEVRAREQEWRSHVWGSAAQAACPVCQRAANVRQSCPVGRGLHDQWVRAAQDAYRELRRGA